MKKQSFYNAQSAGEGNGILLLRLETKVLVVAPKTAN